MIDALPTDRATDALASFASQLPKRLVRILTGAEEGRSPLTHVYLSVSGLLARVPWRAVLRAVPGQSGDTTLSRVVSQGVLHHLRTWTLPDAGGPVLAVGDPDYTTNDVARSGMYFRGRLTRLPHSAVEVKQITDRAQGDVALLGAEATEGRLVSLLSEGPHPFHALHLACHGVLYREVPWMSALALHATDTDDGLLTVDEVSRWRFHMGPRLVVLAACDSGLGVAVPGEGEEGLVRAFLLAGARHVVASLWKVKDKATLALMTEFHRLRRAQRMSPEQALREAQEKLRSHASEVLSHPRAWAAWTIWGPAR